MRVRSSDRYTVTREPDKSTKRVLWLSDYCMGMAVWSGDAKRALRLTKRTAIKEARRLTDASRRCSWEEIV